MTNETALLEAQKRVDSFKKYTDSYSDEYGYGDQEAVLQNAQPIALIAIDTEIEGYGALIKGEVSLSIVSPKANDLRQIKDQIPNTI